MDPAGADRSTELPALLLATEQRLMAGGQLCQELAAACRAARLRAEQRSATAKECGVSSGRARERSSGETPALDTQPLASMLAARLHALAAQLAAQADTLGTALDQSFLERQGLDGLAGRLRASEAERARLARDLHDGPAQYFANAVFEAEYLQKLLTRDPRGVAEGLARLREALQEGVKEIRQCLFDLRLPAVEEMGLVAMLRGYLPEYERQYGITIEATLPADELPLSTDQAIALFRILQEALTNARKHSGAQRARVQLQRNGDEIVLQVEDNGRGFDLEHLPAGHYGLVGMHERARLIGGRLDIQARPGRGARVVVRLSLPAEDPAAREHPEA